MGHFLLTCPFELSNATLLTSTALLLGYPVPHAQFLQTRPALYPCDPWADMLLNDSRRAGSTRHANHNPITHIIAMLASSHGVSTTASSCLHMVPLADPDTMKRGDIIVPARGLLHPRPHAPIPSKLILDFVLRHSITYALKQDTLVEMERDKNIFYLSKCHEQGFAFAPLAANSFGQLGPEFLRFLWALADHAAHNRHPVPLPVLPILSESESPDEHDSSFVVKVLFRHLLTAVYEAITHSVYCKTFPLQYNSQYWETLCTISVV